MADRQGVVYLRTTRAKTPVLYGAAEDLPMGGSKVLRECDADRATVITVGIAVHEALKAYERLRADGLTVRVVDAYSVKPLDAATIRDAVACTLGNAVVVEDQWAEGGLGDAVLECLAGEDPIASRLVRLAVREMPGSGKPAEPLRAAAIDAEAIARAVKRLVTSPTRTAGAENPAPMA